MKYFLVGSAVFLFDLMTIPVFVFVFIVGLIQWSGGCRPSRTIYEKYANKRYALIVRAFKLIGIQVEEIS